MRDPVRGGRTAPTPARRVNIFEPVWDSLQDTLSREPTPPTPEALWIWNETIARNKQLQDQEAQARWQAALAKNRLAARPATAPSTRAMSADTADRLLLAAERQRKQNAAKAIIQRGLNPAYRAAALSRFASAEVTARRKKKKDDNSLASRAMKAVGATPGLSLIPQALKVADTGRRGVIAGAMEFADALEEATGRENADTFGGKVRDTGFSWEDFKRNTLDNDKAAFGFGDVYQEGIEMAGVEDSPLGNIWTRRVVGLAGDVAVDPLTYIPFGVAASGLSTPTMRVGRSAMRRNAALVPEGVRRTQARIARDQFLKTTRRGRALESEVRRAVAAPTDAGALVKRLPGLAPTTAREIAAAPTREAAQEVASRALRTGEYIPDISIRRQALMATTGRGLRAAGGLGLGRRVVRESEGLFDVGGKARRLARSTKGPVAATVTSATEVARRVPVKASLAKAGIRSGDAREVVAQSSLGMNSWDRVNRLLVDADTVPGIVADLVESTLEKVLPKNKTAVDFNRAMADLDADPDAMQALLEAETLIATARGDFGDEASSQLLTELGVGYTRPGNANLDQLLRRAGNRAGLAAPTPSIKKVTDGAINKLRKRIDTEVSEPLLQQELRAGLSQVKKTKAGVRQLNAVAKSVTLASDDAVAQDALSMFARYGETLKDKVDLVGGGRVGLGQKVNPVRQLGVLVTSLTETIPHHQLRFLSTANAELALQERVKAFDSYLAAIGMEHNARSWLRQAVADVQAEADLYKVVEDALTVMANAEGVPPEVLAALLRETQAEARRMGFKATNTGDILDEVQNLSQLNETVALPNPADVKRTLRELAEAMDDTNKAQEVYRYLRDAASSGVSYVSPKFAWLHRTWKLMVVTNLYMPVVGGFVGFAGTEGDLQDRLKGGFQWAAMGALAPTRYVIRVAGIEESARRLLVRGFVPTEFIPGLAKRASTHGLDRPLVSAHLLKSGDPTGSWVRNDLMDRTTGEFSALAAPNTSGVMVKLGRKQPRYLDAWHRIVNHEINDANGALDRILLSYRAGYMTRSQADEWFKTFLKSDDGKLWWRRWKGAYGAPSSPAEAFERQLKFIVDYVPADIARVRLPAFDADFQEVPRSLLKGHVRRAARGEARAVIAETVESSGIPRPMALSVDRHTVDTTARSYQTVDAGTLRRGIDESHYSHRPSDITDVAFREVDGDDARSFVPGANQYDQSPRIIYFANTRNLARGQGAGGVVFEFDTTLLDNIETRVDRRKPSWRTAYESGEAELTMLASPMGLRDSVRSITIKRGLPGSRGAAVAMQRDLDRLVRDGWKKVDVEDGVRYVRPTNVGGVVDVEELVTLRPGKGGAEKPLPNGTAPAFIHAENTWTIPRGKTFFSDLGTIQHQITDKFIFGGPTRTMHRHPMARAIYKDEYTKLVRAGVEPKRAQEMADMRAINTTNEVMFNQNNESRFAQKVDIIFPFQQPREELVRVWAPLMFNNKIRTIQLTSLGARALEAGVSNGTFYEYTNPYTGEKEWRAKIPGSARLSRALGGVNANFDFGLRDLLFLTQDNMGATLGVPSPGGPFFTVLTRSYIDAFPEHYGNLPDPVKSYLFPFGQSGRLGRNEPNRLWMAFMGTPAPWEFANEWEQKEEYKRAQINMFLHLRYDHFKKTGEWKDPTQAEVEEATKAFFQTQALMGAVWPAPNRYIQPWEEMVTAAQKPFLNAAGDLDYYAFINEHPSMAPFITARGEFVGPDTYKNWTRSDEERAEDYIKHWQETRTLKDFRAELKENALTAEAWQERNLIPFQYADWELADAYIAWETKWLEKHPTVVEATRNNYFRDQHLNRILNMAEGPARDRATDEWRKKYDVSGESFKFHVARLKREGWEVDYWKYSRPSEVVVESVAKQIRRLGNDWGIEQNVVAQLNPAEQVKYWKQKQSELVYYDGSDPERVLDDYWRYSDFVGDVYRRNPNLATGGKKSMLEEKVDAWRGDVRSQISAAYAEIDVVSAAFDELKAKGEEWSAEGQALYAKRSALYDLIKGLKNQQFQQVPGIIEWYDDMNAVTALMRDGKPTRQSKAALNAMLSRPIGYGGFIPSNEELSVLNMPKEVREAYTQDLITQLSLPSVKGTEGKLYWEWLTDFQQDWLSKNLPADMVNEWKADLAANAADRPKGGGAGGGLSEADNVELQWAYEMFRQYSKRPKGAVPPAAYVGYLNLPNSKEARKAYIAAHPEVGEWLSLGPMANMPDHIKQAVRNIMVKFGKWEGEIDNSSGGFSNQNPELAWAYEMFKQYSKRAEGAKAPAGYAEYLALPANYAVRNQFLEKHPDVAKWISMGPMANMPAHVRFMVQNIMIKNGKWEGEITSDTEINDIAFAREQLKRWNLRGTMARPLAYDTWLQMPSGVAKAQYLDAHPEIQEWLKLGPMSNMPDAYQDVVRDIMVRYGEWTQETDGLGKVIQDYYATPGYAREQYLEKHPELVAYWNAIRSPEEARMSAMVDQYFSIQDPNSKHAFLIIHPELKQHFIDARTKRYEKFLTHVAIYMGGHPDMFERYLERQEDVLNDLLLRYATPPLLREVAPLRDAKVKDRQRIRG